MFVKNDLSTILFNDEFKEELTYMFLGEIILNKEEILWHCAFVSYQWN